MPHPSSNKYDEKRKQLRKDYEDAGIPDKEANKLANAELQGEPGQDPDLEPPTDRARGPKGTRNEP